MEFNLAASQSLGSDPPSVFLKSGIVESVEIGCGLHIRIDHTVVAFFQQNKYE